MRCTTAGFVLGSRNSPCGWRAGHAAGCRCVCAKCRGAASAAGGFCTCPAWASKHLPTAFALKPKNLAFLVNCCSSRPSLGLVTQPLGRGAGGGAQCLGLTQMGALGLGWGQIRAGGTRRGHEQQRYTRLGLVGAKPRALHLFIYSLCFLPSRAYQQ